MPATTKVFTPFRANKIRVTRLDACGTPATGSKVKVVSDGLISVEWKGSIDTGTEVEVKKANGDLFISEPGKSTLKYVDLTIKLTGVHPDICEISTGFPLITDGQGNAVGIAQEELSTGRLALETWTEIGTEDGDCDGEEFGYFLTPFLVNGQMGDFTLNDGAMDATLTVRTKRGAGWGTGPAEYLVADSSPDGVSVVPSVLLTPVGTKEHYRMFATPVAPPADTAGAVAIGG
jgi:hypothetical protein